MTRLRRLLASLARWLSQQQRVWDVVCLAGLVMFAVGLGVVYWPAMLMTVGLGFLVFGAWAARLSALAGRKRDE